MRFAGWVAVLFLLLVPTTPSPAEVAREFSRFGYGSAWREPSGTPDRSWMDLPRLVRIWKREGLRAQGVPAGLGTYLTVTDDETAVVALDVATGQDRWRFPLPNRKAAHVQVAGSAWVVAQRMEASGRARIYRLNPLDGKPLWSQDLACPNPEFPRTVSRLFLFCRTDPHRAGAVTLVELDTDTGKELGRLPYRPD